MQPSRAGRPSCGNLGAGSPLYRLLALSITAEPMSVIYGTKRTSARACVMSASDAKRTLDFLG